MVPLQANSFLNALSSFLASYSVVSRKASPLTLGKSLKSRERLTTVALLDTNVDVVVHLGALLLVLHNVISNGLVFANVREGVYNTG